MQIAITSGADVLRAGYFADYSVTAWMSDGTVQVVTTDATLSSSDPSVAPIDARGRVNALGRGVVTLSAAYQQRTATRTITIVPDYSGTWSGTYTVRTCSDSGVFGAVRYCRNLGVEPLPVALTLSQSGPSFDEIAGFVSIDRLAGSVAGHVTSDGRLVLGGSYVAVSSGGEMGVEIVDWLAGPFGEPASGQFTYVLTLPGSSGDARITGDIQTLGRQAD